MLATAISHHSHVADTKCEPLVIHPDIGLISVSGNSGTGKNFLVNVVQELSPATTLIRSCTTREPRGPGQDEEYEFLTDREFNTIYFNQQFQWTVKGQKRENGSHDRYGTRKADLERALQQEVPSIMHLVHDKVSDLERFMAQHGKRVLKLLVVCDCKDSVRRRIVKRSSVRPEEVEGRVAGFYQNQQRYRQSGLYNGLIVSSDDKTPDQLRQELVGYLTNPILNPRVF